MTVPILSGCLDFGGRSEAMLTKLCPPPLVPRMKGLGPVKLLLMYPDTYCCYLTKEGLLGKSCKCVSAFQ